MVFVRVLLKPLFILVIAANCAPTPAPDLYFLDAAPALNAEMTPNQRIGLAEIELPTYARKQPIASRLATYRIVQDDDHRWATPPTEQISSTFSKLLEGKTQNSVVLRPYPRGLAPSHEVRITFDRFLRDFEGTALMSGQYLIINRQQVVSHVRRFDYSVGADAEGYEGYMAAVIEALSLLADDIAADVVD
ncbi:MAG: ABC-type transport auxiliary lipoprotein family protein [Pseudomonadota bacterium]